jgi:hypothetical protein
MMKAVRTSETSVDNHFTRQYIPEDNSERVGMVFSGTMFVPSFMKIDHLNPKLTRSYSRQTH